MTVACPGASSALGVAYTIVSGTAHADAFAKNNPDTITVAPPDQSITVPSSFSLNANAVTPASDGDFQMSASVTQGVSVSALGAISLSGSGTISSKPTTGTSPYDSHALTNRSISLIESATRLSS